MFVFKMSLHWFKISLIMCHIHTYTCIAVYRLPILFHKGKETDMNLYFQRMTGCSMQYALKDVKDFRKL